MTRRLMIVDDSWANRVTLQEILIQEGWDVVSVEDGPQAIQMASENQIDLVFMDIHLAGMNGVDTYSAIKAILPDCSVVMMTGYAVNALVQQALTQGAIAVLQKPVAIEQLLTILKDVAPTIPS